MNRIAYSTSTGHKNGLRIARVAAAGRVMAERVAREARENAEREARHAAFLRTGQSIDPDGYGDYCHVCSRATDHWGEHTEEQISAWRERWVARWGN